MLQTEMTTNIATVNNVTPTDKQADIIKRLEDLNKWQEEQKKLLEERQIMQRQMLGIEQQNMYQMLGLQSESEITLVGEGIQNSDVEDCFASEMPEQLEEDLEENSEESLEKFQMDEVELEELEGDELNHTNLYQNSTLKSCHKAEVSREILQVKAKKPFLKKGEGLKQRFKIDPHVLRLDNLPKYKFANAHPKLNLKPLKNLNEIKNVKAKPVNAVNNSIARIKTRSLIKTLDAQEQHFQNLLITSKNTCNSTPDTKSSFAANKMASFSNAENIHLTKGNPNVRAKLNEQSKDEVNKQPADTKIIAWSKILDPLQVQPVQVPRNCTESLPQTDESIFELLEQKANEGSFDMESSCLKEFMARKITEQLNETDDNIPVDEQLKFKRLKPIIRSQEPEPLCSSADEVEEFELTEPINEIESDDTTHKTMETTNSFYPQQTPQIRVRFSDSNETHEYEEEDEGPESTIDDNHRTYGGAIPQNGDGDTSKNELFAQFKQALFAALQIKADQYLANDASLTTVGDTTLKSKESTAISNNCDNSIFSPACKDLQEKTDMIKIRLAELEKEIQVFKNNNVMLMKAKQEHELQKSLNAQEHLEAMECLNDEKIRMEIYLHDERIKLEDEKRQFEQNMKTKTHGVIAKERRECERLKEKANELEMQLKSKESNHTSAQARLRTQIRNLEREQSKLHQQIETLTRENKRLENENLKISREQNNKILLEINRNIAKLAPKQIQQSTISIPDEGPPTLGSSRTVSKCIVTAAAANRNAGKLQRTKNTKYSSIKTASKKKTPLSGSKEVNITSETNFVPENQQHQNYIMSTDDEGEGDDMTEFQINTEKNNLPLANVDSKSPHKNLAESQNEVPLPPPSSPRSSGGCSNNMKREIVNDDGSKDIWYLNGNLKKISADGMIIRMLYFNKDIKETNINKGTVKYYYAETNTWHTTYLDGLEIFEFPNGLLEHRYKDGIVEIHYPNNSVKIMNPKDEHKQEEWRFPDGTHLVQMHNGDKILSLPNGQKEIHNKLHKRREYPDGTVKIVYPDGSTETRYSNGRVRLKDKDGKLVMDTDMAK